MPKIVIADVPEEVLRLLKKEAARNRRPVSQEALAILERALRPVPPLLPFRPIEPKRRFTHKWLMRAMRQGRD